VLFLFKGLCDPVRARTLCASGMEGRQQFGDHTYFYARYGPAVCVLDASTVAVTIGPQREGQHMQKALAGLTAKRTEKLPAHAARAFELVMKDEIRIAGSGKLSNFQKGLIKKELEDVLDNVGGEAQDFEAQIVRLVLKLTTVDTFEAYVESKGNCIITGSFADKAAAADMHKALEALEARARQELQQALGNMPGVWSQLLTGKEGEQRLFRSRAEDTTVAVTLDSKLIAALISAPLLFVVPMMLETIEEIELHDIEMMEEEPVDMF